MPAGPIVKWTIEKFIHDAKEIHGDKYDYSKVTFRTSNDKVTIICPIHGEFQQKIQKHTKGQKCPNCAMIYVGSLKRSNLEKFIELSKLKHGDKYDYSLVEYKTTHVKVKIICPKEGHGVFEQTPASHQYGRGCPICRNEISGASQRLTTEIFIERATKLHNGKYDYSKAIYKNSQLKLIIICPKHGEFLQRATSHLNGLGCQLCANQEINLNLRLSIDEFISRATTVHCGLYDYSKITKLEGWDVKIPIVCKLHGDFLQTMGSHLCGRGCPTCMNSTGEVAIHNYLDLQGIKFEEEKKFPTCKYISTLRFDFYLPDYNTLIEFQGIQHYPEECRKIFPNDRFISKDGIFRDEIKLKWCEENQINLLIIKYTEDPAKKIQEYLDFLKG
jgi:hypothetical protein